MHRDELFIRKLALLMQGLLYHCTVCTIYFIFMPQKLPSDLFLPALFIPLFLFSLIRNQCNRFSIFLLSHVLASGIYLLFVPDTIDRIVIGLCITIMFVLSIRLRLKPVYARNEVCPPIASICLFLLVYVTAQFNDMSSLMQISYYEIFIYLILFTIYKSLNNTTRFLKSNQDIDMFPFKQIKFLNKIILCIFMIFLLIGMIGAQQLPLEPFLSTIGGFLLLILRGILRFIFQLFGNSETIAEEPALEENPFPPLLDSGEISPLLQLFEQFLKAVFYLLVIYFLVKVLLKFFYELYQRFYAQQKPDTDESEFLWKKIVDKEKIKKIYNKKEPYAHNADLKIRKIYKKYIRQKFGKKTIISSSQTPTELETTIAAQKNREYTFAHAIHTPEIVQRITLYEKARYSQWECDQQDVEKMKQNVRNNL